MQLLVFECPYCQNEVEVGEQSVDETLVCGKCRRPFRPEIRVGRLVQTKQEERRPGQRAPERSPRPAQPSIGRPSQIAGGEKVLIERHPAVVRRHPLRHGAAWLVMIGGFALTVWALMAAQFPWAAAAGVVAAIGLAIVLYWHIEARCTTLKVTDRRTILRRGIFSKRTSEVRHNDVRNLQVHQTVFERMFGVGDLAVSSAGQADLEIEVEGIRAPNEIADHIRRLQGK